MKTLLLTLCLVAVSAAAFGNSRITFDNRNRPVTLATSNILSLDLAGGWAGKPVPVPADSGVQLPSGVRLVAGLFAGATSGSETLVVTLPISEGGGFADGFWQSTTTQLPGLPAGATTYFRIDVWDSNFSGPVPGAYFGSSGEFTAVPTDVPFIPPSLSVSASSTWAPGPLFVSIIPEPGTFALACLGAAAMLVFRRRR